MNEMLILSEVQTSRIQYIAIAGSILLLALILVLIRNKKIKEEYSLLWLIFGIVFLVFSVFREALEILARVVGIAYAPAALFLLLLIAIFFILIQFSVIISRLSDQSKKLNQEVGILRLKIKELEERKGS
ncbi:MAG TPA: DUF2304 domain-containing protein [Bacteroidales bacterium]|nr:DUF2304 domain-containing protein [Bacteroidales bacterium]